MDPELRATWEDIKREVRNFFTFQSRRERSATNMRIVVDPGSFLIGAFGAAAVGSVTEESDEALIQPSPNQEFFLNSLARIITYPLRTSIRFLAGGCIYVVADTIIYRLMGRRFPLLSGAITGLCFANPRNRNGIFIGSVLGFAIFAQLADMLIDASMAP